MKFLISTLIAWTAFAAQADVGDKYSLVAKTGRASLDMGLLEIVGMTVYADTDGDALTANVLVKAALSLTANSAGDPDYATTITDVMQGVREDKFMVGIVYDPTEVTKTQDCLGSDFAVLDPENLPNKTCYVVVAKDVFFK
jgi:hypothetical protein